MFGVDLKTKTAGRTEPVTEPPPRQRRPMKMMFGVEVEDPDALPEASPAFGDVTDGNEVPPELLAENEPGTDGAIDPDAPRTGERTSPGITDGPMFSLQTVLTGVTVFGLLCGLCLAVALSARADRFRTLQRAEAGEEKAQLVEGQLKLVQQRVTELEADRQKAITQLTATQTELDALKKDEAKSAKSVKARKHKR